MRIALDTNILAYVAGLKRASADPAKIDRARDVIARLSESNELVVATQVLGELFNVMVKGGIERPAARDLVDLAGEKYLVAVGSRDCFRDAFTLAVDHQLQIWDALILVTSATAGCALLLSEDMQDGFTTRGITVANPFVRQPIDKLAALLA